MGSKHYFEERYSGGHRFGGRGFGDRGIGYAVPAAEDRQRRAVCIRVGRLLMTRGPGGQLCRGGENPRAFLRALPAWPRTQGTCGHFPERAAARPRESRDRWERACPRP